MDRRLVPPTFSNAPQDYNQRYMQDIVRALNDLVLQLRTPGLGRNTTITLTDLPTDPTGLEPGTLWNSSGVVLIAGEPEPDDGYVLQWNESQGKAVWVDPSTL
jgi:hypothetical protein